MSKKPSEERREYLKSKVNPILEVMVADLMKERPEKVVDFMAKWIADKGKLVERNIYSKKEKRPEGVESSDENDSDVEEVIVPKTNPKKMGARQSVSAEAFGMFNKKQAFTPKVVQKSLETTERLSKRLGQAFMFQALDDKEKDIVIKAMEECFFKKGQHVIKQDDDGEVLYVVDKGKLDCFKKFTKDADETYLKTYVPGESFGELA